MTQLPADELSEKQCIALVSELSTGQDSLWRTIPWETSLIAAQNRAVQEQKPIFIWAMDGHPLGCT